MREFFLGLLENRVLIAGIIGWFAAQAAKVILILILERKLSLERFFGSGGMPSSHSATVCSMAVCCGILYGTDTPCFAIASIFAFIVMYDACNVRLETGKQAVAIKELQELLRRMGKHPVGEETLKELVGHTIPQVIVGALMGIVIGCVAAIL